MADTTEIQDVQVLSLEKVIQSKLVQNNVTDQVLAALKKKYGGMQLKSLQDKESYLEIKDAAKECAKVRTLTVKLCKEGRERAVAEQKEWIKKEKEIVGKVSEVESVLDAEISKFDAEVDRLATEEKNRQEDAYINRQATLTKMGAVYSDGSFSLGEASFEAALIKGAGNDEWDGIILPKFNAEYEQIEQVKIAEEKKKEEEAAEFKRKQDDFLQKQKDLEAREAEMIRQQQEATNKANEARKAVIKGRCVQLESLGMTYNFQHNAYVFFDINVDNNTEISLLNDDEWNALIEKITPIIIERKEGLEVAERAKIATKIEAAKQEAVKKEQERIAEEARQNELKRQQDEARKIEALSQASDKVKYADLIQKIGSIALPEMRSGQYRGKVAIIREKIEEIISL